MRPQFVPSLISLETGFFLTSVFVQQMLKLKEYENNWKYIGFLCELRKNFQRNFSWHIEKITMICYNQKANQLMI